MQIQIDFHASHPIYMQIMEQIQHMIATKELQQGDQLPTVRQLATDLRVNFNTVARAYRLLDEARLISTQQGRGTYVWEAPTEEAAQQLRWSGIKELTQRYFDEAERLGYDSKEIWAAVEKEIAERQQAAAGQEN